MKKVIFPLISIAFLLAACGGKEAGLTITDPSSPINTAAGDEFQIVIESNPTTGYHWEIVGDLDPALQFVVKDYNGDEPVAPGSGGVDVWKFKALSPGETHITLGYYPPSNEKTDPQQTVTFTVIAK